MRALLRSLLPFFILCGFFFISEQIERTDTLPLLICYSCLFLLVGYWIRNFNGLLSLFVLGILARALFIFHLPELSQDFYRFLWDGQLQQLGINPYLKTPKALVDLVGFPDKTLLFEKMGALSNGNYSNYPPASQLLFKIAALAHQTNPLQGVLVIRLFYFIGEFIVFFAGVSFLKKLNLAPNLIGWYFLNPLVIIEGIGNLHAEAFMLCFTLLALSQLHTKNSILGGLFFGCAVAIKLLPLLIVPLFYRYLGGKQFLVFCGALLLISAAFWVPFWEGRMFFNYKETIALWFTTFEFNGSFYNLIRAIGYQIKGYNIIRQLGQITPFIVGLLVLIFTFLRPNYTLQSLIKNILFLLSIYFFMATTVHPWYIINLIFWGIISGYAFPLVWSLTVFWSYSAYGLSGFEENPLLLFAEYLFVYGVLLWELIKGPLGEHLQKPHFFSTQLSPSSTG